jgi:Carboxypeptidase regulatory-like domain
MWIRIFVILMVVVAVTGWIFLGPSGGPELVDRTDRSRVRSIGESTGPVAARLDAGDRQRPSIVTGRVTREGQPVPASVVVRPAEWDFVTACPVLHAVNTGPGGSFEVRDVPPGRYEAIATTEDGSRGRGWFEIRAPGVRVDVQVPLNTGRLGLRGRVRWADGRPFLGLLVYPRHLDLGETNGRFSLSGLEPGEDSLGVLVPGRLYAESNDIALPRDEEYEFVVGAGLSSLTGRVLALPGRTPVRGARLQATVYAKGHFIQGMAETDSSGRFTLDVCHGEIDLEVEADGYRPICRAIPAGTGELELLVITGTRLSGTVVQANDGKPVPRVKVTITYGLFPSDPVSRSTTADDAGRFEFPHAPCGRVDLSIEDDDWVSAPPFDPLGVEGTRPTLSPGVPHVVELRARRAASIPGRVVDDGGKGIPGALVVATQSGSTRMASTDDDGAFSVRGLLPGVETTLSAEAPGLARIEIGPLVPVVSGATPVEIRLPDPRWLEVTVLDAETGHPVPKALISAVGKESADQWHESRWQEETRTDADGRARAGPVPGGPIGVLVAHDGYVSTRDPVPVPESSVPGSSLTTTIRLMRGATISGRVLKPDGTPATDGDVRIGYWRHNARCKIENGSFVLRGVIEGRFRLRASTYLEGRLLDGEALAAAGDEDVTITLVDEPSVCAPGPVALRLLDPAGKPVLWAMAMSLEGDEPEDDWVSFSAPGEVRTDEYLWEIYDHGEGLRFLIFGARSETGEPLGFAMFGPITRSEIPVEVRLPPSQAVSGLVRTADGRPAPGIHLMALVPGTRMGTPFCDLLVSEARTDDDGRFRLGGLGPGEYEIRVERGKGHVPPEPVVANAGATDVELILKEAATATITVLDWRGEPVSGASVKLDREPIRAVSDARGVAVLEGLDPESDHTLDVEPPRSRPDLAGAQLEDWKPGPETISLERRWIVAGVVRDEQGRCVADAWVQVQQVESQFNESARTRSDGTFRIIGVPAGRFRLSVGIGRAGPRETGVHKVEVQAGREDLVLTIRRPRELLVRVIGDRDAGTRVRLARHGSNDLRSERIPRDGVVTVQDLDAISTYALWVGPVRGTHRRYIPEVRGDAGDVTVVLDRGKSISGRLIPPRGSEIPSGVIRVVVEGPGFRSSVTVGSDMVYEVSGIPDGEWDVMARGWKFAGSVHAEAGTTADITLERE